MIVDLLALWDSIKDTPHEQKLSQFLANGGVEFYDTNQRFVKSPKVGLVGIGGLPFEIKDELYSLGGNPVDLSKLSQKMKEMMGITGAFSFMNPKGTSASDMADVCFKHGHFSICHSATVNLVLLGYSVGVENELNSQRDLVHLGRITVARTKAQNRPPVVVLDEKQLGLYQSVIDFIDTKTSSLDVKGDALESKNLIYPAAKATACLLTGSIRNIQKLLKSIDDTGKEFEYIRLLKDIQMTLKKTLQFDIF